MFCHGKDQLRELYADFVVRVSDEEVVRPGGADMLGSGSVDFGSVVERGLDSAVDVAIAMLKGYRLHPAGGKGGIGRVQVLCPDCGGVVDCGADAS